MDILDLMLLPALECLILVGIHSYLGLHVIRRRVIFVDLALAQIAALGTTVGFVFGILPETLGGFLYSLTFCLVGAALFAFTRVRDDRVPQEAVIGLVYAITASLAILVVQKTKGIEHMEGILVGSLLWVGWADVITAAIAYSVIGAVHYVFRRQFLQISDDPVEAYRKGMHVRMWDFLFYLTFGFVITFSVRVAGVLLVFVFLVAPAILAVMVTDRLKHQLLIGWGAGTVVTILGLYASYVVDMPCGPTVVAFYGIALLVAVVAVNLFRSANRTRTAGYAVAGVAIVVVGVAALILEGKALSTLETGDGTPGSLPAGAVLDPAAKAGTTRPSEEQGITTGNEPAQPPSDPEKALNAVRRAKDQPVAGRLERLACLMEDPETPPFYFDEAAALAEEIAGGDLGIRPDAGPGASRRFLDALRERIAVLRVGNSGDDHERSSP